MTKKIIVPNKVESEEPPVTFSVSQTVRLKSGGPCMIIEDLKEEGTDMVTCVFFDHTGHFYRTDVSVNVLMHFKPKF